MSYSDGVFDISPEHGFLPVYTPSNDLPKDFDCLVELSDKTPIYVDFEKDQKGLLSIKGALKEEIKKLPNLVDKIDFTNKKQVQTLYRLYSFLASSYLLEPSYHTYLETGEYGKAENFLPANIAQPLYQTAKCLDVFPWLDYHYSYCLGNVFLKDKTKPATWDNMELVTKFAGTPDEAGFIAIHVDINQNSPKLIESILTTQKGLNENNLDKLYRGLKLNYETMVLNNERRRNIYKASDPKNYNQLRMFIMGIKGNEKLFGEGVVYEGVEEFGGKPVKFRGQTGAQDDIIPTEDIFTGLHHYYPENCLTKYLYELRNYRPKVVQNFMEDLKELPSITDMLKHYSDDNQTGPIKMYLLMILEQIYKFRNGHWMMVQQYILKQTKYETATGGTPITTWLPNQIEACLEFMSDLIHTGIDNEAEFKLEHNELQFLKKEFKRISNDVVKYRAILSKQKEELKKEGFDPDTVYEANENEKEY